MDEWQRFQWHESVKLLKTIEEARTTMWFIRISVILDFCVIIIALGEMVKSWLQ